MEYNKLIAEMSNMGDVEGFCICELWSGGQIGGGSPAGYKLRKHRNP